MVRDVPDADTYVPAEMSEMAVLTDQPMEQKNRTVGHLHAWMPLSPSSMH